MTNLDRINRLAAHGAKIVAEGISLDLTEDFYYEAIDACKRGMCNAITYNLAMPDIDELLMLAISKDGHVDSGSRESVMYCIESR